MGFEIEFPCGLKIKVKNNFFEILSGGVVVLGDLISCPLHGKKCSKPTERGKK